MVGWYRMTYITTMKVWESMLRIHLGLQIYYRAYTL